MESMVRTMSSMYAAHHVHRVQVVGDDADAARVHAGVQNGLQAVLQAARHGAFADHHMAACPQAGDGVRPVKGLVIRVQPRRQTLHQLRMGHGGHVSLHGFMHGNGIVNGLQKLVVLGVHIGAHALGKTHRILAEQRLADDLHVKMSAAGFQIRENGTWDGTTK